MPIRYGTGYIVPTPTVSITQDIQRRGDGNIGGILFNITLNGQIINDLGSPNYAGSMAGVGNKPYIDTTLIGTGAVPVDRKQGMIQDKISQLYDLFNYNPTGTSPREYNYLNKSSEEFYLKEMEIMDWEASGRSIFCNPRIKSIDVKNDNNWVTYVNYSITMESNTLRIVDKTRQTNSVFGLDGYDIPIEETWSFEESDDMSRFFKLSYNLSATSVDKLIEGKFVPGWAVARQAVVARMSDREAGDRTDYSVNPPQGSGAAIDISNYGSISTTGQAQYSPQNKIPSFTGLGIASNSVFMTIDPDGVDGFVQRKQDVSFLNPSGLRSYFICYDPQRSTSIERSNGKFSANQNWKVLDTKKSFQDYFGAIDSNGYIRQDALALEDFNVNVEDSSSSFASNISIDGTITGIRLDPKESFKDKFSRANLRYKTLNDNLKTYYNALNTYSTANIVRHNQPVSLGSNDLGSNFYINNAQGVVFIFQRIYDLTGLPTYSPPLTLVSKSVGRNPAAGTLTYSYKFTNKPFILPGVKDFTVNVSDDGPSHVFTDVQMLGRMSGPIIQSARTRTRSSRNISVKLVFESGYKPEGLMQIINALNIRYGNNTFAFFDPSLVSINGPIFIEKQNASFSMETGEFAGSVALVASN